MTWRYGFELEGFYHAPYVSAEKPGGITLPPKDYPTDGFPGLVEIRTKGGAELNVAYGALLSEAWQHSNVIYSQWEHTFTAEQKRELRKREWNKVPCDVRNIYEKAPRPLKGKTLASLQINISYLTLTERKVAYSDGSGKTFDQGPQYGLFDVARVVYALDRAFVEDIKSANRQTGEYCIKDGHRLEYRSLPNCAAPFEMDDVKSFLSKIRNAVLS